MSASSAKTNSFPRRVRDRWFDTSTVGTIVFGESLTKQEFKDECDINVVLARYRESPPQPWASPPTLRYGDFADVPDFLAAQLLVREAEEHFARLDGLIRDRFEHDPVRFLEFVHDPKNITEARRLGIFKDEPPPPPPATPPPATP